MPTTGSPTHRIAAALLVSTLAGTALVACGAEAEGSPSATVSDKRVGATAGDARITWGECPPPAGGRTRTPRLDCGTLKVPLDYRKPGGTKIDVASAMQRMTSLGSATQYVNAAHWQNLSGAFCEQHGHKLRPAGWCSRSSARNVQATAASTRFQGRQRR
ncbi:hypothetical protein SFUMM280S_00699 [Streptomyces fumanus]